MLERGLRVLLVASECQPLAKAGGLGDVVAALGKALARRGHEVRVVLPLYGWIDPERVAARLVGPLRVPMGTGDEGAAVWSARLDGGVETVLLEHRRFYDRPQIYGDPGGDDAWRFGFLSRAALEIALEAPDVPDVVHAHDWPSAPATAYLAHLRESRAPLAGTASVLTIHNLEYQGRFAAAAWPYLGLPAEELASERFEDLGGLNLLKGGIASADALATVSPTHAREMLTPPGGHGLEPFLAARAADTTGILNGVDDELWNPETDALLPRRYSVHDLRGKSACKRALQERLGLEPRADVPLFGIVSRFAPQKGLDLLIAALPPLLEQGEAQLVVQGSGDAGLESFFRELAGRHPRRAAARIGYSEEMAHAIHGGADFFLMPSRYEPCGLGQMYALRYGTLPIVRATGGLADTVVDAASPGGDGTGLTFTAPTPDALGAALRRAVECWYVRPSLIARLRRRAMAQRFSWDAAAARYEAVYAAALAKRGRHGVRRSDTVSGAAAG
ncbi:MAG: glycogen synthase GlgA [Thermodesulfobacteriota bacterium]